MRLSILSIIAFTALATSLPQDEEARREYEKRQNADYSQLLALASQAGIAIPTDNPALLLSLAPLAASLNSLLPTAPVLSVLETAAPSGLLSSLVHDPSFAASWISSFEEGPSPSWFLALPTSVRSYLHTYADGGNLAAAATAAAGIESVESVANSQLSASRAAASGGTESSSITSGMESTTNSEVQSTSVMSQSSQAASSTTGSVSSSMSAGAAAKETGVLAAGAVAMAGILGLAVAL